MLRDDSSYGEILCLVLKFFVYVEADLPPKKDKRLQFVKRLHGRWPTTSMAVMSRCNRGPVSFILNQKENIFF